MAGLENGYDTFWWDLTKLIHELSMQINKWFYLKSVYILRRKTADNQTLFISQFSAYIKELDSRTGFTERKTLPIFWFSKWKYFHFVSDFISLIWANTMGALGSKTMQWKTSKWNTCRSSSLIRINQDNSSNKFHTRLPDWAPSTLPAASENESEYWCTFELWWRSECLHVRPHSIKIFLLSWQIVMVDIVANKRVIQRQNTRRNSS